jgi:6-pyruvoyltetrahydropterin/6-carboxytetrahydropterin synthase
MTETRPVFQLKVTSRFSASHQLRYYQGRCEDLHGHNFHVEVWVEGEHLERDTEILMDFKELKSKLAGILDGLDHKHLNELAPFAESNPSSENLARYIYRQLRKEMPSENGVRLLRVGVSESENSQAFYLER